MTRARHPFAAFLAAACAAFLVACGGGEADPPPPDESGAAPPTLAITQHPQSLSVTVGQPASFSVAASGTAPIAWQWQRDGTDIAGATATTYAIAATTLADSGATFRAVATNPAGSASSNSATLTVTAAAPVLTVTPQPASTTVAAGAAASFAVGGSCSSGTLAIQWQRNTGSGGAFVDIVAATAATYTLATTTTGDSGAQFRARLDCSGQAATTSDVATLTVTAPQSATLSLLPLLGLRDPARINEATVVDQLADGSYVLVVRSQLKRISADLSAITPLAGIGGAVDDYADGVGAAARFNRPFGLAHDAAGVVYVADTGNRVIRRVAADGTVTTLAGSAGQAGSTDGSGSAARFSFPRGIALGPDGDLYVADESNNLIRRVTTAGVVSTYAGSGSPGSADGPAAVATFNAPFAIAVAANGDVIVGDRGNHRVRRILRSGTVAGNVETLAGSGASTVPGNDGVGTAADIAAPSALYVRGGFAYVRDAAGLVRRIDLASRAVTTFAGSRALGAGYADGPLGTGRLSANQFGLTGGVAGGLVAVDPFGLRAIDASGFVTTFAAELGIETDAGTGVLAQAPLLPVAIGVDSQGRVAVSDGGRTVRRVDTLGNVSLVAGLVRSFHGPIDATGSVAQFRSARSIAGGPSDVLYIVDGDALRRVAADGTVTTVAGSTDTGGAVDAQGPAARFNVPGRIAVAGNGDVFVADTLNHAIRRVDALGNVVTYAGVLGQAGAVDGAIAQARLAFPDSLALASDGSLWFTDGNPARLRRVSADGSSVSTPAGVPSGIVGLAPGPAGTVYYMVNAIVGTGPANGLYAYDPATSNSTLLMRGSVSGSGAAVLGSVNPALPQVQEIALLGPKRILVFGGAQLLVVTLP